MFPGMTEKSLRVLYSIGLGVVIVLFVGLGIATFYPAPELSLLNDLESPAREAARVAHKSAMEDYNRNVTVAALVSALAILAASIWSGAKNTVFAGGFLIGGLLTLVYGLMRGLTSGVTAVAFFSVAVGLVVVIYLGHQRFFSTAAVAARAKAREEEMRALHARMAMQPSSPSPLGTRRPVNSMPSTNRSRDSIHLTSSTRSRCSHIHRPLVSPGSTGSRPTRRGLSTILVAGPLRVFGEQPACRRTHDAHEDS